MKINDTTLFSIINSTRILKKFSSITYTGFCTAHSKTLFSSFLYKDDVKYFHITDSTKKRLENVPTEHITGKKLTGLNPEKGLVYFNDGLHFLYLIRKNGVYIMTSRGKRKNKSQDGEFYTSNLMDGFLYYDLFTDAINCFINNPLDIEKNKDSYLFKERWALNILRKMLKEAEKGFTTTHDIYNKDYVIKHNSTRLCLQAFLFIFYAKVIETRKISQEGVKLSIKEKLNNKKQSLLNVIEVDTFYDENLKVINPFSVSGHFRNQPYGKDRSKRKLIYIDGFMKSGYERKATKLKLNR